MLGFCSWLLFVYGVFVFALRYVCVPCLLLGIVLCLSFVVWCRLVCMYSVCGLLFGVARLLSVVFDCVSLIAVRCFLLLVCCFGRVLVGTFVLLLLLSFVFCCSLWVVLCVVCCLVVVLGFLPVVCCLVVACCRLSCGCLLSGGCFCFVLSGVSLFVVVVVYCMLLVAVFMRLVLCCLLFACLLFCSCLLLVCVFLCVFMMRWCL